MIAKPDHPLAQTLSESKLQGWWPFHNTFNTWDWPEAEVVFTSPRDGSAVVLAGSFGSGRMVLSGSDPDYHYGDWGSNLLLSNELAWAAGKLPDSPPVVATAQPAARPAAVRLWLAPPGIQAAPGDQFEVAVQVAAARPVSHLPLPLTYDPAVLAVEKVAAGDFLGEAGSAPARSCARGSTPMNDRLRPA